MENFFQQNLDIEAGKGADCPECTYPVAQHHYGTVCEIGEKWFHEIYGHARSTDSSLIDLNELYNCPSCKQIYESKINQTNLIKTPEYITRPQYILENEESEECRNLLDWHPNNIHHPLPAPGCEVNCIEDYSLVKGNKERLAYPSDNDPTTNEQQPTNGNNTLSDPVYTQTAQDTQPLCEICRLPDSEKSNKLISCNNCETLVHMVCYGITAKPSKPWHCSTCSLEIRPRCELCPNIQGAMKPIENGEGWAHVSCAIWIPEVGIGDQIKMEPITRIPKIKSNRRNSSCHICKSKMGVCRECSIKNCKHAYHITCAVKNGLEMRNITGTSKLQTFCQKHSLKEKSRIKEEEKNIKNLEKVRGLKKELKYVRDHIDTIIKTQRLLNRLSKQRKDTFETQVSILTNNTPGGKGYSIYENIVIGTDHTKGYEKNKAETGKSTVGLTKLYIDQNIPQEAQPVKTLLNNKPNKLCSLLQNNGFELWAHGDMDQ